MWQECYYVTLTLNLSDYSNATFAESKIINMNIEQWPTPKEHVSKTHVDLGSVGVAESVWPSLNSHILLDIADHYLKCTIVDLGGVGVAGSVLVTHLWLLSLPRLPPADLLDNFLGHVLGSCFRRYVWRHLKKNQQIYLRYLSVIQIPKVYKV